jgi:hypothetical protein
MFGSDDDGGAELGCWTSERELGEVELGPALERVCRFYDLSQR